MLNLIFQILLGIFIVLIMGFIAYSIFDREYLSSIRIYNTNKKETKIFKGIYPFSSTAIKVETVDKNNPYYTDINPSVNQNGGAEYSYNFWLYFNIKEGYIEQSAGSDQKFIILFYKGVKQLVPYKQHKLSCDSETGEYNTHSNKPYILVKNPLVKINNDGSQLIVEYNNINNPDSFNSSAVKLNCTDVKSEMYLTNSNKLGIKDINTEMYNKTWNMITIVLQESPSNEEKLFSNRTNCKIYFNSTLITDRSTYNNDIATFENDISVSTVMKNNIGNLYINPKFIINDDIISNVLDITDKDNITKDCPLKIANMSYYNYALNDSEIVQIYNKGFDKKMTPIITEDNTKIVNGTKIPYSIMENPDNIMPVKPI